MSWEMDNRRQATGNRQLERGADIARRLMAFAVESLTLAPAMSRGLGARHIAGQWIRAATSAGANYEEARAAESRADFVHKVSLAAKEAREACYWIDLTGSARFLEPAPLALLKEGRELAAILGASTKTAREGLTKSKTP